MLKRKNCLTFHASKADIKKNDDNDDNDDNEGDGVI